MAVQKIDYENKIGLQNDENVPNKNKVTDDDMNEIKSKVNNNADELTTAQQDINNLQEGQGTVSSEITSLKNRVITLEGDNTKNKQDIANKVDKVEGKGLSTEDYTTAEKQKLAGLSNYDDTEIKQDIQELQTDISDIKAEQITQNDLLERTQSALINITTPKSSNINVKDSSDLNAKIDVYGISEQETREGYNLFNNTKTISNVTYNSEEDKWVFNLSNIYDHIALKDNFFENIKANTTYTMYLNILKNTANNIITFNPSNTVWSAGFNIQAGKTGVVINNIKTKEDLSSALYDLWFSHTNTITGEFEVQIMLVEGIYTAENIANYEQFGASPSPKYPSEIENVTGNIDITEFNKNTFDMQKFKDFYSLTETGVDDGYDYVAYTTKVYENSRFMQGEFKENTQYALSFYGRQKTKSNYGLTSGFRIYYTDGTYSEKYVDNTEVWTKYTITSTSNKTIDYISMTYAYVGTIWISKVQLEINSIITDFVEHEEQLITFPLAQGQRLFDKDYPASDGIHHVRKQIELDGTENWLQLATFNQFYITLNNTKANNNQISCMSTHFKAIAFNTRNTNSDKECAVSESGYLAIFTKDYATIEEFKSYLAQQKQAGTPVIVEYELEEEEIEPYTEEQQEAYNQLQNVLSYKTVTNVFTNKAQLVFKYIADTKTYVDNQYNALANQVLEIMGGN